MTWNLLQQLNPYEQWQVTTIAVVAAVEYFKFEWVGNPPKLRNYVAQSETGLELFDFKKIVSSDKSTVLFLPCPSIWTERKIAILCPRIWANALPDYKVNVSYWLN